MTEDLAEGLTEAKTPVSSRKKKPYVTQILGLLFNLYVVSVLVVFGPYYNWQYAKENGFVKWLFLGEIVPTAKAAVWPYFVFFAKGNYVDFSEAEKENLSHFAASIYANRAATDILYSKNKVHDNQKRC